MKRFEHLLIVVLAIALVLVVATRTPESRAAASIRSGDPAQQNPTDTETANLASAERLVRDVINGEDLTYKTIETLVAPMFKYHDGASSPPWDFNLGPGDLSSSYQDLHQAMPDYRMEVKYMVAQDDLVWILYSDSGTFTKRLQSFGVNRCEPSGKVEKGIGTLIFRFSAVGKVVEWWGYGNTSNDCLYTAFRG